MKGVKHSVRVELGARSYDIVIGEGLIAAAGDFIAPIIGKGKAVIITDTTVGPLYLAPLSQALKSAGIQCSAICVPEGERSKSFATLQTLLDDLLSAGLERGDYLIALGGGVIGDLTGFAASILKRGCGFIQVPTTLLAQVDSSVGGKTGINAAQGKNLIGSFYQPSLVLADMGALTTLPERQIKAGYAEILKYGLLGDRPFFDWLETQGKSVLALEPSAIAKAVAHSCQAKARIVSADETERGARALLNFGHTFAHALEALAGYSGALLHGEAVSAGMGMAMEHSAELGLCCAADRDAALSHLERLNMPRFETLPPDITGDAHALLAPMWQDKKNSAGALTLILSRGIGNSFVQKNADAEALLRYLLRKVAAQSAAH